MFLIVGLGNPEPEYANTRHNMGFDVINELANKNKIEVNRRKFNALYGMGIIKENKVVLLKPQTMMNLSGQSIREFRNYYKLKNNEIIIIYDDIDIQKGCIRIRTNGSAGSHNGVKSVIKELASDKFIRIRVGTGKPLFKNDLANYVLEKITNDEESLLTPGKNKASEAIEEILVNGTEKAMNKFN